MATKSTKKETIRQQTITAAQMEGGFPFSVKQTRFNKEMEAAILEARNIMSGKQDARRYSSARQLFDELDSEGE